MSGTNEMADAKVENDVNVNLNDSLVEGEPKIPRFSQNPSENGEPKADDAMNSNSTAAQVEQQSLADNEPTKGDRDSNIRQNATISDEFQANDSGMPEDTCLNFEGNADTGAHEIDTDPDAKELCNCNAKNEDNHVLVLNEKPLEAKAEQDEKVEDDKKVEALKGVSTKMDLSTHTVIKKEMPKPKLDEKHEPTLNTPNKSFLVEPASFDSYELGTEDEQAAFAKEVESFYKENNLEFKAPKFYKEELNLLKLWREVIKLGGYEQVTSCKLWRIVGESFKPPKTCTTVSWTFRIFYEKALLEYEKHKMRCGELPFSDGSLTGPIRAENQLQTPESQAPGSGRARRDAAARAMQGWHSQRLLGNGQVCDPIIKDKNLNSTPKGDKQLKTNGLQKRKKPSSIERAVLVPHMKTMKLQADTMVIDIGPPADWVKINVQRTNDCFEIYALVPGLLREEVHVQSDPAGRLIISGQPEQLDNPWGVAPFKKVVSLPSRIDPHQTSAVVTLHGQLFVRVPFEQPDV